MIDHPYQISELVVTIVGSQGSLVQVRDSMGREVEIDGTLRPKGTGYPAPGERWVIVKRMGRWTLDAMVGAPAVPTISGDREGLHPIIEQVLDALVAQGAIVDRTIPSSLGNDADLNDDNDPPLAEDPFDPDYEPPINYEEELDGDQPLIPGPAGDDEAPEDKEENKPFPEDPDRKWVSFTVVSYNQIRTMGPRRVRTDLARLFKTRASVILLQEAHMADRDAYFAALRAGPVWGVHRPAGFSSTQTAIWRQEVWDYIDSGEHKIHDSDGAGTGRASRWVNWTRLRHRESGVVFTFLNTHLDNNSAPYGRFRDTRHAERLRVEIQRLPGIVRQHAEKGPIIFGGDWNVDYFDDARIRNPELLFVMMKSLNFVCSYAAVGRPGTIGSIGRAGTVFDHVWLRNKVPGQVQTRWNKILTGYFSDHRPVAVTYRVRSNEAPRGR